MAFRLRIQTIPFYDNEGIQYLEDIDYLSKTLGIDETFSATRDFLEFEVDKVLPSETQTQLIFALTVVFLTVLFITASLQATVLVVCIVSLVNVQMVALTQAWGLSFNLMTAINMTFALGVAIDYSSHIAHAYLSVRAPTFMRSNSERREYKARIAIS